LGEPEKLKASLNARTEAPPSTSADNCRRLISHTSPARVKLWKRRAEAMALREQNCGTEGYCRPSLEEEKNPLEKMN
jgi:hypothetical protein